MKSLDPKLYTFSGLLSLVLPAYTIGIWIYVANTTVSVQAIRVQKYHEYFPSFLQDALLITLISLICTTVATVFFLKGYSSWPQQKNNWNRVVNIVGVTIGGILSAWLLFTLM